MTEKRYATNVVMILGVGLVLILFIFILVAHHRDVPDRVQQNRGTLLGTGSSVAERIKPAGPVSVPSAETKRAPAKKTAAPSPR